jgi:hypothetical protein
VREYLSRHETPRRTRSPRADDRVTDPKIAKRARAAVRQRDLRLAA